MNNKKVKAIAYATTLSEKAFLCGDIIREGFWHSFQTARMSTNIGLMHRDMVV